MDKIRINLYDILITLSNAVDLVRPELFNHHQMVAYLSFRIAEEMDMSTHDQHDIIIEGLLHDIGAISKNESSEHLGIEFSDIDEHAQRGAKLLEECELFHGYVKEIRYHHLPWNYGKGKLYKGDDVPISSHILHLADKVCSVVRTNSEILSQVPYILSYINNLKGSVFMDEAVEALISISNKEHIWLELVYKEPLKCIPDMSVYGVMDLELEDIVHVSKMFSRVIDFRSHYTATHSVVVANIAKRLGELIGFSKDECTMLLIAGHLHDLGKLAIDDAVLEKPSSLNKGEIDIIRSHTFYTYQLLQNITGFETITKWAAYHHEKLNGEGYPFHLTENQIPLGSRIVAVADIFTAISENRPYRKGMDKDGIVKVMTRMAEDGSVCGNIVHMLFKHFDEFQKICEESYLSAVDHFEQWGRG